MIGRIVGGFELVAFIGRGSFGSVYKCVKDNTNYAIKIFSVESVFREFNNGEDNRITREIDSLKSVDSEYVVRYIADGDFIDNATRYIYVIMDYVDGEDLETFLSKNDLTESEAIAIFKNILMGVKAIHSANLIHRDLKPANIYLLDDKKIKILDFGLSKLIDFSSITNTGDQLGTPIYMSPEQISDSKNIDYRSDYYALGVILYKLLTKSHPYGDISSREELYYKIKMEPHTPIRMLIPTVSNSIDNLIDCLLEKINHKRPNSINEICNYLDYNATSSTIANRMFQPSFYARLWNEKTVLEEFYKDGFELEHAIFPINHQDRQKNLLKILKDNEVDFFIDPATMRLAYDSYSEVKGLISLPYAPRDLSRLEIESLDTYQKKKQYVKQVIEEQLKHQPRHVVAPFHISNNSNLVKIKMDNNENWFSLDVKLAKESREYLKKSDYKGNLILGFCVKTDILTSSQERDYFLNVISSLDCDKYWIYVDCIDNKSNFSQLYNYAYTLLTLQKSTNKPVIAGRIGPFGLILLAFGIHGFESGTSRFESFYEDLYKDTSEQYNMYMKYYIPELLSSIAIDRKNPAKIIHLAKSKISQRIECSCPYCNGLSPENLANELLAKKHFLYRRNEEILNLRALSSIPERVSYIEEKVRTAISNYKELRPIFKDDEYKYLNVWLEVIIKLKEEWL